LQHRVSRADNLGYGLIADVKILGRCPYGFMAQHLLKHICPGSLFQKMSRKAMAQGMYASAPFYTGHSFGSALGLYLAHNYPELFHAYIGIGQVISYEKSVEETYGWLTPAQTLGFCPAIDTRIVDLPGLSGVIEELGYINCESYYFMEANNHRS